MASIIGATRMIKYLRHEASKRRPKPRMRCYRERGDALSALGYAGYAEYLESGDWRTIREKRLRRHPNCLLCGKKASQVHHLSYSHRALLGLDGRLLVTLCDGCHAGIEFDAAGEKRTLAGANAELIRSARRRGKQGWACRSEAALEEDREGEGRSADAGARREAARKREAKVQARERQTMKNWLKKQGKK